jgi:uncharacterized caspase-like protein
VPERLKARLEIASILVCFLACALPGFSAALAAEKRIALVIGNAAYLSAPVLDNTMNDAQLMSDALRSVGFEVLDGRNLNKDGMGKFLRRFAKMLQGADAGLFYFAGHGLQFQGQNFLLPIDAVIEDEFGLRYEATRLEDVIATLHYASGIQILVLDACRNNPFVAQLARRAGNRDVSVSNGLAPVQRTQGMLVAYATQANDVAADGSGSNSPFTEALAREISQPGEEIATVFRNVQIQVHAATKGRQIPELSMSLLGNFYFNTGETDIEAWKKISMSNDALQLVTFIDRYPDSHWAGVARMRLAELTEKARLIRESAERELLIGELTARAKMLGEKIAEAEMQRQKAVADLEHGAAAAPEKQAEMRLGAAESERGSKAEQNRLAMAVKEQENLVLTLSAERQRLEAEKKAAEEKLKERLDVSGSNRTGPASVFESQALITRMHKPPAASVDAAPSTRIIQRCADIVSHLQVGEPSQAELDELKHCRP